MEGRGGMEELHLEVPVERNDGSADISRRISGPGDASFVELWFADAPAGARMPYVMMRYREDLGPRAFSWDELVQVDEDVTFSQVVEITDEGHFSVDPGGWGGFDADWIEPMARFFELVAEGYSLRGFANQVRSDLSRAGTFRYRKHRALAADWRDQEDRSTVALELRQLVLEHPAWYRTRFDAVFGLDPATGTALLHAVGYRRTSSPKNVWVESGFPESTMPWDGYEGS